MNIGTACCRSASCSDTACPGRPDPALTRRVQERELLRQCSGSGQCDSRQIAAHISAGEMDGIGVEAADAPRVTGAVPIVTIELRPVREPFDWSAVTRWGAAVAICIVWTLIVIYRR